MSAEAPGRLAGQAAIVTGGSRGIGFAVAQRLVAEGASVVITGRREAGVVEAAGLLGARCVPFACHVADAVAAQKCVDLVLERFGRFDILVNNAGTNPAYGPSPMVERAAFEKTFEVNVWSPLLWAQLAWRKVMAEHGGVIVNMSSLAAVVTDEHTAVYSASKAALNALTCHLAVEFAPRVRVNAVMPGLVETRLAQGLLDGLGQGVADVIPMGRLGAPTDVGEAVLFLCSPQASWITGTALLVDGGMQHVSARDLLARNPARRL